MTTEDLRHNLKDSYEALENYRFQHASGQLENYKSLTNTKRDIAKILTVLKQRELAETKNLKK
ncbi:MAG: 50S ribosomal protein L29 [Ignavibacteriae bacterium]|nr:50S ribosomal protein L29 [Ignavibacteriota bacterium]